MKIKAITTIALCTALLTACQQGEFDAAMGTGGYPADGVVRITTQLDNSIGTRGTSTYAGTTLGLSLTPASGNPTYTYTNEQWITSNNGQSWTTDTQLYWQSPSAKYHIHAYAPYCNDMTADGIITHSIASDQTDEAAWIASDLVGYTTKSSSEEPTFAPGTSLTDGKLKLMLDHCLSQLIVNITLDDGWEGQSVAQVLILNTPIKVNYNTVEGRVTSTNYLTPIKMMQPSTATLSYKAIVAPVQIADGTQLLLIEMSNGEVYRYTSAAYAWEPSKTYELNLVIRKVNTELMHKIAVTDWVNGAASISPNGAIELVR